MISNTLTLSSLELLEILQHIPQPPLKRYTSGAPLKQFLQQIRIAIDGARHMTTNGKQVNAKIADNLAARRIVIVSGLAMNVDATSKRAAVDAGETVMAVLSSPIDTIGPLGNRHLAQAILQNDECS